MEWKNYRMYNMVKKKVVYGLEYGMVWNGNEYAVTMVWYGMVR